MKLLKIEEGSGFYMNGNGEAIPIGKIDKKELLRLAELALEYDVELDEYNEDDIKNPADQIVYKSIYNKLSGLTERQQEFKDETDRLYLDAYEKYRNSASDES